MSGRFCFHLALLFCLAGSAAAHAQSSASAGAAPTPPTQQDAPSARQAPATPRIPRMPSRSLKGMTVPDEPADPKPAARDFTDARYRVSLHIPAGWNFERKDGVLSNFGVETRTARARTDVRGVAELNFNPWPPTTFAGALFYYSVIPRSTAAGCVAQTRTGGMKALPDTGIGGISFHHGRDNHGAVCTEARDEAFTAMHAGSCLRFDLVINTFCSDTSGAMEITPDQLKDVQTRLAAILGSVRIGAASR